MVVVVDVRGVSCVISGVVDNDDGSGVRSGDDDDNDDDCLF